MSWKQVNEKEHRRPAGNIEALFAKYYGLSFQKDYAEYHLSFATKYRLIGPPAEQPLITEVLEKTWSALRFEIPSLCVTFDLPQQEIVYRVPDEDALQQWLARTIITKPAPATPDAEFWSLVHDKEQCLYHFPHRSELIVRGPHWNIDGIGAAMLSNRFYHHLDLVLAGKAAEIVWGQEVTRLQPPIEIALDLPKEETPEITAHAEAQFQALFGDRPSLGLEYQGDVDKEPGKPTLQTNVYSQKSSAALTAACRAQGFTVTSAIHTALVLQTHALAPESRKALHVVDGLPIDHRKYFPAPYNGESYAMTVCVSTRPIRLPCPAEDTFTTLAPKLTNIYKSGFDISLQTRAFPYMCRRWDPLFDFKPPLGFPLPSNVMLSNSGILEDYIQARRENIIVEEADLYAEVVSRNSVLNVHTWGGRVHLNLEYNRGYFGDRVMGRLLEGVKQHLETGLGVELEVDDYRFARG